MSDKQAIWERQDGESTRWYSRFVLFRDMGPNRSLLGAVNREEAKKSPKKHSKSPSGAWSHACEHWQWRQRAEAWDEHEQKRREAQQQAYVDSIMQEGYALVHERVKALGEMARTIDWSMRDPESNDYNAKWIDPDKINQWRGILDDIARELGHRVKLTKQEITGKDGGPIETKSADLSLYTDDELAQLKALALKQAEASNEER